MVASERTASRGSLATTAWLSLLVPAYEYPTGVRRILDLFEAAQPHGVECLVNDDSTDDSVEAAVRAHPCFSSGRVSYVRNRPGLGAVHNWNALLQRATGEYILFMHHDECPADPGFFDQLRRIVQTERPRHVVLNCLLPAPFGRWRSHMPPTLRRWMLRRWPTHLLRHNTFGPPSVFVTQRQCAQPFDTDLKWLVDVDWYVRSLQSHDLGGIFVSDLCVLSVPRTEGQSITAALGNSVATLVQLESRTIEQRLGRFVALRLQAPRTPAERLLSSVESGGWTVLRTLLRAWSVMLSRPAPPWPHSMQR